jgi:hypothetical protein
MKKRKPPPDRKPVVRRPASERKRLPADLEAFAGGDDDALWRRPARARIDDPRPVMLVPGVANRDARAVYEARERRLRRALDENDRDAAAIELAEAAMLRVWRGHSIVGFDAFTIDVLGLDRDAAQALLARGKELLGASGASSEEIVATWMRAEAGALEGHADAAVRFRRGSLAFEIPIDAVPAALNGMGRRAAPIAREQAAAPKSVIDRPKSARMPKPPRDDD